MSTDQFQQANGNQERNTPTHVAKVRHGHGKTASYERIGVAWVDDEKQSVYVRLYGTQIISDGFTLYPIEN